MRLPFPWRRTITETPAPEPQSESFGRLLGAFADRLTAQVQESFETEMSGHSRLGAGTTGQADLSAAALRTIRQQCRDLWRIDTTAAQAVSLLTSGVYSRGLDMPRAATPDVQAIVDAWFEADENQRQLTGRHGIHALNLALAVDGEMFYRLHYADADPQMLLTTLPVDEIVDIIPHPDNAQQAMLYRRVYRQRRYDYRQGRWETGDEVTEYIADWNMAPWLDMDGSAAAIPQGIPLVQGAYLYHVSGNTLGQRGVPELYRALDWHRAYCNAVSDLLTYSKAAAMFAWTRKVGAAVERGVARAAAQLEGREAPPTGSVHVGTEHDALEPINVQTGAISNIQQAARQSYLAAIRAYGFGEHWYGDASTGNLATATAMELPAIWRIQDRQELVEQTVRDMLRFTLTHAQYIRRLPQMADLNLRIQMPDPQPMTTQYTGMLIMGIVQGYQVGLLDAQEAAAQMYRLIGADDPETVLARQFQGVAPGEQSEQPLTAEVAEVAVSGASDRLAREFERELQTRVLNPWHRQIRMWLETLEDTPDEGSLARRLALWCTPNLRVLRELLVGYSTRAYELGGQIALNRIWRAARVGEAVGDWSGPVTGLQFRLQSAPVLAAIAQRGDRITGEVTQTMLNDLHTVLREQFYEQGLGPRQIASSIDQIFPPTYANRGETIARTETMIAQMEGKAETYRQNGVQEKEWAAFLDDKTRDTHADAHGQRVLMDEPFMVGGNPMQHPGDGPAEEVINCRCDMLPIVNPETLRSSPWTGAALTIGIAAVTGAVTRAGARGDVGA